MGRVERRRMGLDNDVYCVTDLVSIRLCVGFRDPFFYESKREKGGQTRIRLKQPSSGVDVS